MPEDPTRDEYVPDASSPQALEARAEQLLRLLSRAERLEALPRTGWLVCGVTSPESIAAHSYMVTLTALWLADHMPPDAPVDTERVLRIALLHDIGESVLTDLPAPVKRFMGAEAIAAAEGKAARRALEGAPASWPGHVEAYARRDSLEARIVKAADRIQMLAKALQYQAQGRGDVARFWDGPAAHDDLGIPLVGATLARLRQRHREGRWFDSGFD